MTSSNGSDAENNLAGKVEASKPRIALRKMVMTRFASAPEKPRAASDEVVASQEKPRVAVVPITSSQEKLRTTSEVSEETAWTRFRLWRRTRPFWSSILLILAGLLVLWGPLNLLQYAFLPGSMLWAAILVGTLLVLMGVIQLIAPFHALITGAIGIVLSLISLFVALGGLGIGMILGIIGGALAVAWRPVAPATRPIQSVSPEK